MAKRFLSTINLPKLSSDPETGSEGEIYYNTSSDKIRFFNGSVWADLTGSGGGGTTSDSFATINVPNGTDPVADSSVDTLNITESNGIIVTGDSSTDTVNISTNATSSNTASTIVSRDADQSFDITGIDFDTTDTIAAAVGRLSWDDGEGTITLGLKGGNVNLSVGQEVVALCYNGTGSTINKGSVVYISGAQGQRPSISLSDADTEVGSSKTFGVVAENIANGADGFVCTFGIVTGLDTSSFTAGQALWLSSTAGQLTNVIPTQPAHSVFIGYCLHVNASSGRIFVNPQNGYELQELHNVLITSVADNHILSYDNATSLWKNQGLAAAIQEVDGTGSNIDADQLDGQEGTYYLDWTNTTNKPDPTITLGGDLSGSITLTDLAGGTLTATVEDDSHNHIISNVDGLQDALNAKAALESPALTGTPTAPTAPAATNTTQIATTAFVRTEVSNLVDAAPTTLDTLNELAAALGDDPNFATTISTALGGKEPTITAGTTSQYWRGDKSWQTLDKNAIGLGNVENTALSTWGGSTSITTLGTVASGTWQASVISASYIDSAIARLSSPTFTGTVTVPTPSNATDAATKGYVDSAAADEVVYQTTEPTSVAVGTVWIDSDSVVNPLDINTFALKNSPALTGTPTAPTAAVDTNTTQLATTAFVIGQGYLKNSTASSTYLTQASAISTYAPLANPTLTGTPLAPTASAGTNTTQIATTAYVRTEISNLVASAPAALDTLNELATALGNDANFSTTVNTALSNRVLTTGGSTITVDSGTTIPLTIQNNGTGNSFVVNDVASDTTPFVIDADGNVGIGISSPSKKIDLVGQLRIRSTENGAYSLLEYGNSSTASNNWHVGSEGDGTFRFYNGILGAGSERLRIDSNGMTTFNNTIFANSFYPITLIGDIDGAKWAAKLGGYNLTWGNDGTNATALESWTIGGRTYRGYVQFTNSGDIKISGNFIGAAATNAQTGTSYTLVLSDQSKIIEMNNAAANTLTVPTDASVNFPVGTVIDIFQTGAGQTTVGGAGVTINARPGLKLSGQWATATLIKRAANTWLLTGSLSA